MSFVGYVQLEDTLETAILMRDSSQAPVNLDALPTIRIYGPEGLLPLATATATLLDTGTITGATNATPIVITDNGHGLTTGTFITVSGVVGNTAANGSFTVTMIDANTFSLNGSVGNGSWVSGGTWNVAGLYTYAIVATSQNGFEVGTTYTALVQGAIAGQPTAASQVFIVT